MNDRSHRIRTLWLTGMLHAFTHLYQVALLPLYLRIQQDLNLASVQQATLLVSVLGVAYFLPSYPLGLLADRFNRKTLLGCGLLINGLGFVGLAVAPNYAWALASVLVAGFGGSFYHPSATALVAGLFPEARGRALGFVGIGASIGFFFGPVYTGWRVAASGSWRVPVFELGALGILAACAFAWLANEEKRHPKNSASPETEWPSSTHPSNDPRPVPISGNPNLSNQIFPTSALWIFFFGASLALSLRDFAGSGMATSASLFLQNAHGFSPKATGLTLSGIFLASVISNPLFGSLSDSGRMRWVAFVLFTAALLISIFPRVPLPWMPVVLVGYGFFFMASYPIVEAALMESVPGHVRGRVFGLFITVGGLVGNVSHWAAGAWIQGLGSRGAVPANYIPLYAALATMVALSVVGLPLLNSIRKREHLPLPANGVPPFSALSHSKGP